MKVVINKCYGGFGLSLLAETQIADRKGWKKRRDLSDIKRHDLDLVVVVEKLGERAGGEFAKLKIVTIPDGVDYTIEEYDGMEYIAEKHRTWG